MEDLVGAQRVFRILELSLPTAMLSSLVYVALVDPVFSIPGALTKRLLPKQAVVLARGSYTVFGTCVWVSLHLSLLAGCRGSEDLCSGDPLRHKWCVVSSVAVLILLVFGAFWERAFLLFTGQRKPSGFVFRLKEVLPACIAWFAVVEHDGSGVLLLMLLTSGRVEGAVDARVGKLVVWYRRCVKLMVHVLALQTLRGACATLAPKFAVAASLAAVVN
jgi:hypothetical protein